MLGAVAARELVDGLRAPAGSVSASLWYDRGSPYIRVYLAKEVLYLQQSVPKSYHGFDVVVEAMPAFAQLTFTKA